MKRKNKKKSLFHRRLSYDYPLIKKGKGIYLYDESGKKYIDACGGALVANLGHGIEEIAGKIKKLAGKMSYLHGSQFTTREIEDYAKEICQAAPKGIDRVFFVSGGSEAIESAVKLARQYHYDSGNKGKYKIIARTPAYHGSTILTTSLSTKEHQRRAFLPYLFNIPRVKAPFCYHCPFGKTYPKCNMECARQLEKVIRKEGPSKVSAFIAEPVIGASAGAVVPPPEYFPIVRRICNKYNVLLILDEVMCGFGRTGKLFAFRHWKFTPDIVAISKGIGGGFVPLAAVFCREKILKTIRKNSGDFIHGFTFENNPLTAGVGLAVLRYIRRRRLIEQCAKRGKYLLSKLRSLRDIDIVGDVRGLGLMTAVEFVEDRKSRKPFPRKMKLSEKLVTAATKKGLNLYFAVGFVKEKDGDAVMFAPPFIVSEKEIDKIVSIFRKSILEVRKTI